MGRERLFEIANLAMDALELFWEENIHHCIEVTVGTHPEVWIHENTDKANGRFIRYYGHSTLGHEYDINFNDAEKHIRRLMEEVMNGSNN